MLVVIVHLTVCNSLKNAIACLCGDVRSYANFRICGNFRACNFDKKAVLSQRWPHNAPYIWVPSWQFSGLPDYAHSHYSQRYHGLLFRSTLWMFLQNLKSVALPVPEINRGIQKIWAVPGNAHAPFSPKFLMVFYSDSPYKYTRQIWSP